MYDAKSEAREFVGEHREEAIAKACEFFGVEEDALAIGEFPAGAVRGLGPRFVIVGQPRHARARRSEPTAGAQVERRADRRGDGGPRGDRQRRAGTRGGGGQSERAAEPAQHAAPTAAPLPSGPSVGARRGEIGEVGAFVLGVVERMGLGPFEIAENQEGDLLVLEVRGGAARALATGDGRCGDALQLLANQAAGQLESEARRVVVDVEGDADAREAFLSRLAKRVARRARESGRAVALDPMNGRDRRLIHLALRDDEGIATMSIGKGRYRQVVVAPEGTAEFDEAQRQPAASAEGGET